MRSLAAYFAQRFPSRVFVPAIALHAAAAWWASANAAPRFTDLGAAMTSMTLLFMQFRLWDDLQDADRDRATHPDRVLVTSRRRPFEILLWALTAAAGAGLARRGIALAGFGGLCVAFIVAYRAVRPRIADVPWRYGVLLVKYPAFVALVALSLGPPAAARLLAAALAAYLVTSLYEAWHHDRRAGLGVAR